MLWNIISSCIVWITIAWNHGEVLGISTLHHGLQFRAGMCMCNVNSRGELGVRFMLVGEVGTAILGSTGNEWELAIPRFVLSKEISEFSTGERIDESGNTVIFPSVSLNLLYHHGYDFCYRIAKTLFRRFGASLLGRKACYNVFEMAVTAETPHSDCDCSSQNTADLQAILDVTSSSPYLIRMIDRHHMKPMSDAEINETCSYILNADSYHDEALNLLSPPSTNRFIDDDFYFDINHSAENYYVGQIFSDEPHDIDGPPNNERELRLLCIVYSMESHHESHLIRMMNGWGSRCTGFVAFSTSSDSEFPNTIFSVPHEGEESYSNIWRKIVSVWEYVHQHYLNEFDYFFLSGDDTYVIVGHLYGLLHYNDAVRTARMNRSGTYLGRQFRVDINRTLTDMTFNSGGPGYILDGISLIKLVEGFVTREDECNVHKATSAEDTHLAACLRLFNITPMESRDILQRNRFHHMSPHETYQRTDYDWFAQNSMRPILFGPEGISDTSVSFHWVQPGQMSAIDFYLMRCQGWADILDQR